MLLLSFFDKGKKRQKYYKVLRLAQIGFKISAPPHPSPFKKRRGALSSKYSSCTSL